MWEKKLPAFYSFHEIFTNDIMMLSSPVLLICWLWVGFFRSFQQSCHFPDLNMRWNRQHKERVFMPALFKQETSFKQAYLYSEVIYTSFGCEWACVGRLLLCMRHVFGVCIFGCTFPCTRIEKVAVSVFEKEMFAKPSSGRLWNPQEQMPAARGWHRIEASVAHFVCSELPYEGVDGGYCPF